MENLPKHDIEITLYILINILYIQTEVYQNGCTYLMGREVNTRNIAAVDQKRVKYRPTPI